MLCLLCGLPRHIRLLSGPVSASALVVYTHTENHYPAFINPAINFESMKSKKTKGAYDAPRVTPAMMQTEAAILLAASSTALYVDIDDIYNMNVENADTEYFEVTF